MNVEELLELKRPLTREEAEFLERETLSLAEKLRDAVAELTRDLDPDDAVVQELKAHPANVVRNVEQAIECGEQDREARRFIESSEPRAKEKPYKWEELPIYAWSNEFARVIGRLLASLHKRYHLRIHLLGGQAMLMSNCIALGHQELPPGETPSPEVLRAYRFIGHYAAERTLEMLDDLARVTGYSASDVAHGKRLVRQIRDQFAADLSEVETGSPTHSAVLH